MTNIIIAFAAEETRKQYTAALESAGYSVFRCCCSANEVKRTLNECGDGIVVSGCRLPDGTADALAWDLGKRALMLVVGRPQLLDLCEHPDIFRLTAPCAKGELISAVSMLDQLYHMRLPRRSEEDKQIIADAKAYLMKTQGLTEPEAHRALQKGAMDRGLKLKDFAAKIMEN